jgi:hypothetical protein
MAAGCNGRYISRAQFLEYFSQFNNLRVAVLCMARDFPPYKTVSIYARARRCGISYASSGALLVHDELYVPGKTPPKKGKGKTSSKKSKATSSSTSSKNTSPTTLKRKRSSDSNASESTTTPLPILKIRKVSSTTADSDDGLRSPSSFADPLQALAFAAGIDYTTQRQQQQQQQQQPTVNNCPPTSSTPSPTSAESSVRFLSFRQPLSPMKLQKNVARSRSAGNSPLSAPLAPPTTGRYAFYFPTDNVMVARSSHAQQRNASPVPLQPMGNPPLAPPSTTPRILQTPARTASATTILAGAMRRCMSV